MQSQEHRMNPPLQVLLPQKLCMETHRLDPYLNNGSNHSDKVGSHIQAHGMNGVSVAVRKRSIVDYELERGDYDIVSIDNTNESMHDVCMVHNGVMHEADAYETYFVPCNCGI